MLFDRYLCLSLTHRLEKGRHEKDQRMSTTDQSKIAYFPEEAIQGIALPERFTFPFDYTPHPLTEIAVAEVQHYLETQTDFEHNFGLRAGQDANVDGKMFGVLVVLDGDGKLGYLSAFSGKLAGSNHHPGFVPPVFDMLAEGSFFLKEIVVINSVNARIRAIEADKNYQQQKQHIDSLSAQCLHEVSAFREQLRINRENRNQEREAQKNSLSREDYNAAEAYRVQHSYHDRHQLNILTNRWDRVLKEAQAGTSQLEDELQVLKQERKERSTALQQQLFKHYTFLNQYGQSKSLQEIFITAPQGKLPAGAGECATPKLLQFAFANGYTPLAMAEFWWGASPKSEIRKHKHYYPACTSKCKPILAHMLEGMPVDGAPLSHT